MPTLLIARLVSRERLPFQNSFIHVYSYSLSKKGLASYLAEFDYLCPYYPPKMGRYELLKKIGSGTYSIVYKVIDHGTKEILAMKSINVTENGIPNLLEIDITGRVKHPNIIHMVRDPIIERRKIFMMFPLGVPLKEYQDYDIKKFLKAMVSALAFLHSHNICHCDFKIENMIVVEDTLKVIDFGLSIFNYTKIISLRTPHYASPEYLYENYNSEIRFEKYKNIYQQEINALSSDYWALGICIGYLFRRRLLFNSSSMQEQIYKMNDYFENPQSYLCKFLQDKEWEEAMFHLLNPQANQRSIAKAISLVNPLDDGIYIKIERIPLSLDFKSEEQFNKLSTWLFKIVTEFKFNMYSYLAAMDLMFRYFGYSKENQFSELTAITSLFMAQKVFEIRPFFIRDIIIYTRNIFSEENITDMEVKIIKTINFKLFSNEILKSLDMESIQSPLTFNEFFIQFYI